MSQLLRETRLLDFSTPAIQELIARSRWCELPVPDRIRAVYDFVRDEIPFGYNESDDLPASRVLRDGYGQCNTKATLLMALLRGVGVPCRLHGFTVHKELQRGLVPELAFRVAPTEILHSWVEIEQNGTWIRLEGFIVDRTYLRGVQRMFPECQSGFCGFAISTSHLADPPIEFRGRDTFIQHEAIVRDFGVYDAPDAFYAAHHVNLRGWRSLVFRTFVRQRMNARVRDARAEKRTRLGTLRHRHAATPSEWRGSPP
jgi:hypothetical protein